MTLTDDQDIFMAASYGYHSALRKLIGNLTIEGVAIL
jgi:hypothetical protein